MLAMSAIGGKMVAGVLIFVGALSGGLVILTSNAAESGKTANSISNLIVSYTESK